MAEAAEEIRRLRAEVRELKTQAMFNRSTIERLTAKLEHAVEQAAKNADEVVALREQMERQKDEWLSWDGKRRSLEQDAERYRWLRAQAIDGEPGVPVIAMPNGMKSGYYMNFDTADYAIDAAIDASRKAAP